MILWDSSMLWHSSISVAMGDTIFPFLLASVVPVITEAVISHGRNLVNFIANVQIKHVILSKQLY